MSSKLKVEELRSVLALKGLDTRGTKAMLVKRLEARMQSEEEKEKKAVADGAAVADGSSMKNVGEKEKQAGADEDASSNGALLGRRKRKRVSDTPDDDRNAEKVLDEDELKKYTIRELREMAGRCGVSPSGLKVELIKRLACVVNTPKEIAQEDEPEEIVLEKRVTATKKGGAILDQWLPDDIKSSFHVLQKEAEIYDATLNQTNVGDNNNKFFVLQILESDGGGKYMVFFRWGRVGVKGQFKLHGPFFSQERAIREFEAKFFEKTKNHWCNRKEFVAYPKYYTWLEMDYSEGEPKQIPPKTIKSVDAQLQETKLEAPVAKFISLICNINMMKQQMLEIGYNAEKLPLGKLSKSTILKGYDVLRRISDVVQQGDRKKLEQLSGEFYTVIPHDFGFKKMRDFVIDTPFKVKTKLEMVAALGEIEIATKILEDVDFQDDPLYSHYQHLCCNLTPIEFGSNEYSMVQKYINNTHAGTHSNYTVNIVHLFRVSRKGEDERFKQFCNVKNRMLLWHGSRLTNWTGILSQGLRIAPPEAPVTGYMFGKGVYFADMFSKSANYCFASSDSTAGVLLLCEVALGDMAELLTANNRADLLPDGKLSTKGVGATEPDMSQAEKLEDGLVVPLGKPKKQENVKGSLLYNEYIVYNVEQIRMRYLIQVNFNYR